MRKHESIAERYEDTYIDAIKTIQLLVPVDFFFHSVAELQNILNLFHQWNAEGTF